MAGLEGKVAGMLASIGQSGKKQERSPSPVPYPVREEERVEIDEEAVEVELEGQAVDSTSEPEGNSEVVCFSGTEYVCEFPN